MNILYCFLISPSFLFVFIVDLLPPTQSIRLRTKAPFVIYIGLALKLCDGWDKKGAIWTTYPLVIQNQGSSGAIIIRSILIIARLIAASFLTDYLPYFLRFDKRSGRLSILFKAALEILQVCWSSNHHFA